MLFQLKQLKPQTSTTQYRFISTGPSYQLFQLIHANIFVNHIYDHYQIFRANPQNQYLISCNGHIKSMRSHASNVYFFNYNHAKTTKCIKRVAILKPLNKEKESNEWTNRFIFSPYKKDFKEMIFLNDISNDYSSMSNCNWDIFQQNRNNIFIKLNGLEQ